MSGRNPTQLWMDENWIFEADTIRVIEEEPEVSPLLGPNGEPLVRVKHRMGFDLTPRRKSDA